MAFDVEDQDYKERILKRYSDLKGDLHLVEINRNDCSGLGISLVGNKDLTTMSVFVNALKEGYPAANSGQIFVGDELLEVNGHTLFGRSHLNATPIFNAITSKKVKLLLLRSKEFQNHIAVPPLSLKTSDTYLQDKQSPTIIERKYVCNSKDHANGSVNFGSQGDRMESTTEEIEQFHAKKPILQNTLSSDVFTDADDEVFCDPQNAGNCDILMKSEVETKSFHNFCDDLETCPILPGRVTKIEIKKDKLPLGCRIVGGIDMSLRRILVFEVHEGGAAAKDGRLKIGDEILEINGQNVHALTHAEVVMQLRMIAPSIKLLVARDSLFGGNLTENGHVRMKEKFFSCREFSIEVTKRPGKSLGISVVPIWKDKGVLVADVIKSGSSENSESILSGDEIVAVNGMPLEHLKTIEAIFILKTMIGKLFMEIHRADVGLLSFPFKYPDLVSPYSPTTDLIKYDSLSDLKKSKNIIKRALPSCFSNGRK